MRWLMAGAELVSVGASFSPAWHRAAARGVVRLARKGAGVMRRRGAEPASTSLFPPLAVRAEAGKGRRATAPTGAGRDDPFPGGRRWARRGAPVTGCSAATPPGAHSGRV